MKMKGETKLGYKQTEGMAIPADWEISNLAALASMKSGTGITSRSINSFSEFPCYGGNGLRGYTDRYTHDGTYALIGRQGALCGNVVLASGRFFASEHALVVAPKPQTDIRWLSVVLGEMTLGQYSESSAQPGLSRAKILRLLVAHPKHKDEQRAIAEALADTDALISALEEMIAKKRDLKQAAMQHLLTGKTRLPGFSGEWEVKRLGDHVRFLKNGTLSRAQLAINSPVKYLHYGDIHGSTSLWLRPRSAGMPCVDPELVALLDRLENGDLVFADASEDLDGVGKSIEIADCSNTEVVSGLHTIAARFDKKVLADGFKAYLQFIPTFRDHLRSMAAGTKVLATNRKHIASATLALPDPPEQTAIAEVLSAMDADLAAVEVQAVKARAVKQGMMQVLLTGRVRLV